MNKRKSVNADTFMPSKVRQQRKNKTCFKLNQQDINFQDYNLKYNFSKNFMNSVVSAFDILSQMVFEKVDQHIDRIQLEKIVQQAMINCETLLNHKNWQINPNGPFDQRNKQSQLRADEQPKVRSYDPILGFQKPKIQKKEENRNQSELSLSRFRNVSKTAKSIKISSMKHDMPRRNSRGSNISNMSIKSIKNCENHLIPLRTQTERISDLSSTKRNLQDFLREKKLHKQTSGQLTNRSKFRYDQKQNLKIIQQFQGSIMTKTLKDINFPKPMVKSSTKDEHTHDYDGTNLVVKNPGHSKNKEKILKSTYRVMKVETEESQKQAMRKSKMRTRNKLIRLRPVGLKLDEPYSMCLTDRSCLEQEVKILVENGLLSSRIPFRELSQGEEFGFKQSITPPTEATKEQDLTPKIEHKKMNRKSSVIFKLKPTFFKKQSQFATIS